MKTKLKKKSVNEQNKKNTKQTNKQTNEWMKTQKQNTHHLLNICQDFYLNNIKNSCVCTWT